MEGVMTKDNNQTRHKAMPRTSNKAQNKKIRPEPRQLSATFKDPLDHAIEEILSPSWAWRMLTP
jgi:hypothetical protein